MPFFWDNFIHVEQFVDWFRKAYLCQQSLNHLISNHIHFQDRKSHFLSKFQLT